MHVDTVSSAMYYIYVIIKRKYKFYWKNKGMVCHTLPLETARKQGEMPLATQLQSNPIKKYKI